MKTTRILLVTAFALGLGLAPATVRAEEDEGKPQTTCPVMGGKINKAQYVDHDGKRIYVCCPGCLSALKKKFDTYREKLEKQGVAVADTPAGEKEEKGKGDGHDGHGH